MQQKHRKRIGDGLLGLTVISVGMCSAVDIACLRFPPLMIFLLWLVYLEHEFILVVHEEQRQSAALSSWWIRAVGGQSPSWRSAAKGFKNSQWILPARHSIWRSHPGLGEKGMLRRNAKEYCYIVTPMSFVTAGKFPDSSLPFMIFALNIKFYWCFAGMHLLLSVMRDIVVMWLWASFSHYCNINDHMNKWIGKEFWNSGGVANQWLWQLLIVFVLSETLCELQIDRIFWNLCV